jgi:hypothetical protein
LQVQIDIKDLVKMNPLWAPTAQDELSKGFNSWMDTLPFGDNFHKHLQEKKEKQIWVEKERLGTLPISVCTNSRCTLFEFERHQN